MRALDGTEAPLFVSSLFSACGERFISTAEVSQLAGELFGSEIVEDQMAMGWLMRKAENDRRLICIHSEDGGCAYFVSSGAILERLFHLNVKLARVRKATLGTRELAFSLGFGGDNESANSIPIEILEFGERLALVLQGITADEFFFPLALLLGSGTLASSVMAGVKDIFVQAGLDLVETAVKPGDTGQYIDILLQSLTRRERHVIEMRGGLAGMPEMTLAESGERIGKSRERVRQIEAKAVRKLSHPTRRRLFKSALVSWLISHKGSLMVSAEDTSEMAFIASNMGIPFTQIPLTPLSMMGQEPFFFASVKPIAEFLPDIERAAKELRARVPLNLGKEDWMRMTRALTGPIMAHQSKSEKVHMALKTIGKACHFHEVYERYCILFPEGEMTEHNVHAILSRETHDIVWIGKRGTYALTEWGYERPNATLFDTVAEIVIRAFTDTGNPVPYSVVQAEIGKYRKLVNVNSVYMAAYRNPRIKQLPNGFLVPGKPAESQADEDGDVMDTILEQFEKEQVQRNKPG